MSTSGSSDGGGPSAADLVGAWRVLGWQIEYASGRKSRPFGLDPLGLLVYSADGWMNVCIARNDRIPLGVAGGRLAAPARQAAAFASYFSYAGRYEVGGGTVTHHVVVALDPAFVGTRQERTIELQGTELTLSAHETGPGGARRHVLSWRRAATDRTSPRGL